ncbi:MAG: M1 family metallopeptidase [Chloroflexota bacterium]
MKNLPATLILLIALLAACQAAPPQLPTPGAEPPPPAAPRPVDWDDRSLYEAGLIPSQRGALDGLEGASVYHLNWNIAEDLASMTGAAEVRYTNREQVALDEIRFQLLPNLLGGRMDVATVLVDGHPAQGSLEFGDSRLRIPLGRSLLPDESVVLRLEYSLSIPVELESNYGVLAAYDGVLTLAHAYPMVTVYDEEGWADETPAPHGDLTYADASFFLAQVNAPAGLTLAASGREVSRQDGGSRQIVTYAAGPARDFYLAASPDYEVASQTVGQVTFNSYAPKGLEDGARAALDMAVASFHVFDERYAPYPYTEFDLVATPTYALGVEYPGIVALNANLYNLQGEFNGTPTNIMLESVVAHEAGHQWFYNLVGNDQLGEPWLDESLAQFVTWQYYEDRYGTGGGEGFEQSLRARWARVENEPIPVGMPVASYDGTAYSAIVYGRGAFFFEALRDQMGKEAFDAFLQDYTETYSWDNVTGDNMKAMAETHCRCDLGALFAEWIDP